MGDGRQERGGEPAALAQRFERFAVQECRGASPLYERLALGIARDPELLALAAAVRPGQPVPNLFLAAVHALLLDDPAGAAGHPLARWYPSVAGPGAVGVADADPVPHLRAFGRQRAAALERLLRTRRVQTNEVTRAACLLPAFCRVAAAAAGRALGLIEVGASAGLLLNWPRYRYEYAGAAGAPVLDRGAPAAPVRLRCGLRGERPPVPAALPAVALRLGIDLNPLDARDAADAAWLRALVWPDQPERAAVLAAALTEARRDPPRLVAGDALDRLPEALAAMPAGAAPCVFHAHTLNQLPPAARERLGALLAAQGAERETFRVWIEWPRGAPHPELGLARYAGGACAERALGRCDPHGAWLAWQDPAA